MKGRGGGGVRVSEEQGKRGGGGKWIEEETRRVAYIYMYTCICVHYTWINVTSTH